MRQVTRDRLTDALGQGWMEKLAQSPPPVFQPGYAGRLDEAARRRVAAPPGQVPGAQGAAGLFREPSAREAAIRATQRDVGTVQGFGGSPDPRTAQYQAPPGARDIPAEMAAAKRGGRDVDMNRAMAERRGREFELNNPGLAGVGRMIGADPARAALGGMHVGGLPRLALPAVGTALARFRGAAGEAVQGAGETIRRAFPIQQPAYAFAGGARNVAPATFPLGRTGQAISPTTLSQAPRGIAPLRALSHEAHIPLGSPSTGGPSVPPGGAEGAIASGARVPREMSAGTREALQKQQAGGFGPQVTGKLHTEARALKGQLRQAEGTWRTPALPAENIAELRGLYREAKGALRQRPIGEQLGAFASTSPRARALAKYVGVPAAGFEAAGRIGGVKEVRPLHWLGKALGWGQGKAPGAPAEKPKVEQAGPPPRGVSTKSMGSAATVLPASSPKYTPESWMTSPE